MELLTCRLIVISHASIKQVNRSVYKELRPYLADIKLIVPAFLRLGSGAIISAEPMRNGDVEVVPLTLLGPNPRTYYYPQLIEYLNTHKPTVVLLENDPVSRLGFQLSSWCKKNSIKLVCQTYENLSRNINDTVKTQGWRSVLKNLSITFLNHYMAKRIDALLVVNSESERIFLSYGYPNVYKIPLGYDAAVFFPDDSKRLTLRQKLNFKADVIVIAYFGRLVPQKGVHLLIEALTLLKDLNWTVLLDHIHDSENSYTTTIRDLIKINGIEDRVCYFEADHFEIANYMRAADIMVAPSVTTPFFKEQYGRAVQEAMACGCVTIVSDSGHLRHLVEDDSLVFPENNVKRIVEIITRYISDRETLKRKSNELIQRAKQNLTIQVQGRMVAGLLKKLL